MRNHIKASEILELLGTGDSERAEIMKFIGVDLEEIHPVTRIILALSMKIKNLEERVHELEKWHNG